MFGGMWRNPGPSLRGNVGCKGRDSASRLSPGRTNLSIETAMAVVNGSVNAMSLVVDHRLGDSIFSLVGGGAR